MHTPDFKTLLADSGSKATSGRMALLQTLWDETEPITVSELTHKLPSLNEVTLYRALEHLVSKGIVRQVDFRHGHVHYELNVLRPHHHHLVCTGCSKVEDTACETDLHLKKNSSFKTITDHAVEYFGVCKTCAH